MRKARVDENQAAIIRQMRKALVTVWPIHTVGNGCPDILCGFKGRNYLFEIKNPKKPASHRKLTEDEIAWHLGWGGQVDVIETAEDALKIMGIESA